MRYLFLGKIRKLSPPLNRNLSHGPKKSRKYNQEESLSQSLQLLHPKFPLLRNQLVEFNSFGK